MKIGFVTSQETILKQFFPTAAEPDFVSPEPLFTPDDYIAVQELRSHGHEVHGIVWGRTPESLHDLDLIIVRSPWDYAHTEEKKLDFFSWLESLAHAGLPVANPPALMRWLLDKHYLHEIANHGVQVIPTQYFEAGSKLNLATIFAAHGPIVLKQCISAGGTGLFFIDSEQSARTHQDEFNKLMQSNAYMLQPFIPEITTHGEWSLIFFGGHYSHSILKKPRENSILIHADHGGSLHFPVTPSSAVIDFSHHVHQQIIPAFKHASGLTCESSQLLYMRVDVIETENGPVLIECEGVEPELFFRAQHGSEVTFRQVIEDLL